MRLTAMTILGVISLSFSAHADDFGPRFDDTTPPGLADYTVEETPDIAMDDMAKDLQDIMPAAGEEEPENNVQTDKEKEPAQAEE